MTKNRFKLVFFNISLLKFEKKTQNLKLFEYYHYRLTKIRSITKSLFQLLDISYTKAFKSTENRTLKSIFWAKFKGIYF